MRDTFETRCSKTVPRLELVLVARPLSIPLAVRPTTAANHSCAPCMPSFGQIVMSLAALVGVVYIVAAPSNGIAPSAAPPSNRRATRKHPSPVSANTKKTESFSVSYLAVEQYKSQDGQDKWANEHAFHGKTGGVFVDFGCYDGITYSNTWYFERVLNWTGVCAEPNPEVFPRIAMQAGRSSGVQVAVSDHRGTAPFVTAFMRSSLNASAVDYGFLAEQHVATSEVRVKLTTPADLLSAHLAPHTTIDYVNIDVEQLELAILRVWPWETFCVTLFNIENEPPSGTPSLLPQLNAILLPRGYAHHGRIGVDELYMRTEPCPSRAAGGAPRSNRAARRLSRGKTMLKKHSNS